MAAASVGEPAVPVVCLAVAVEGDTHLDVVLAEEVEIAGAELQTIGVDTQVELGDAVEGGGEFFADAPQSRGACQQRLLRAGSLTRRAVHVSWHAQPGAEQSGR